MRDTQNRRFTHSAKSLAGSLAVLVAACGGGDDLTQAFVDNQLSLPAAAAARFTESPVGTSEYQRHLDAATANAGTEFAGEQRRQWCYSVENTAPAWDKVCPTRFGYTPD